MNSTRKIALGLGLASLVTAWFLSGERKQKTRNYISKQTVSLRKSLKTEKRAYDDSEAHYI